MLFFCSWTDRASLLLDAADEADARIVAKEVADGIEPLRIGALAPRAFVAEVTFDEDDEDGEEFLVVDPLPHVTKLLEAFEEASEESEPACEASAEFGDDDEVVFCTKGPDHDGEHVGIAENGEEVAWG